MLAQPSAACTFAAVVQAFGSDTSHRYGIDVLLLYKLHEFLIALQAYDLQPKLS